MFMETVSSDPSENLQPHNEETKDSISIGEALSTFNPNSQNNSDQSSPPLHLSQPTPHTHWSKHRIRDEVKNIIDVYIKEYMTEALIHLSSSNSNLIPITLTVWRNIALRKLHLLH